MKEESQLEKSQRLFKKWCDETSKEEKQKLIDEVCGLEIEGPTIGEYFRRVGGDGFFLSDKQLEKYRTWRKKLKKIDYGASGGGYWFCFCPTGIGMSVKVKRDDGKEIDLTETENW